MEISAREITDTRPEIEIIESLLDLDGKALLELGCGKAQLSRSLATRGKNRTLVATEVDEIQHAKNLDSEVEKNIRFENWGAQKIPAEDASFDVVFMFKSLHHVPGNMMRKAFEEIHRVLKPGGFLYISEPVFEGDFNDVLRIFHDEEKVRSLAFSETKSAVDSGEFVLEREIFFRAERSYENFSVFEEQVLGVTHTKHQLNDAQFEEVKLRFAEKIKENGGTFSSPIRIDLLQR